MAISKIGGVSLSSLSKLFGVPLSNITKIGGVDKQPSGEIFEWINPLSGYSWFMGVIDRDRRTLWWLDNTQNIRKTDIYTLQTISYPTNANADSGLNDNGYTEVVATHWGYWEQSYLYRLNKTTGQLTTVFLDYNGRKQNTVNEDDWTYFFIPSCEKDTNIGVVLKSNNSYSEISILGATYTTQRDGANNYFWTVRGTYSGYPLTLIKIDATTKTIVATYDVPNNYAGIPFVYYNDYLYLLNSGTTNFMRFKISNGTFETLPSCPVNTLTDIYYGCNNIYNNKLYVGKTGASNDGKLYYYDLNLNQWNYDTIPYSSTDFRLQKVSSTGEMVIFDTANQKVYIRKKIL